jgi:pimeloyl-ACP methyl ester carboxylesterase
VRYIYLHGFASGPSSSKAAVFRQAFQKQGLDLRVPDLAAGDFENLTITGQLEVVRRECAGGPARLIGSSLGGYVAALYAARHAEVDRLVLLAPAFGFLERWPERLGREQYERWKASGYMETYHYGEQRLRRLSFRLCQDAQLYERHPDVRQPTLIVHGLNDDIVPIASSREFAARRNVDLHAVDSDHELMNVIDDICREALRFLH